MIEYTWIFQHKTERVLFIFPKRILIKQYTLMSALWQLEFKVPDINQWELIKQTITK